MSEIQLRTTSTDTLVFYPPEDHGAATATLTLVNAQNTQLDPATWPLTVNRDNVSTTTSVATTQGGRVLTLAAVTNIVVDVIYILGLPDGRKLRVKVIGINATAIQVYLDQPVSANVAIGATLTGLAFRYPLTTAATATVQRRCQATWAYQNNGSNIVQRQSFDIVNAPWELKLAERDIELYDHTFGETTGSSNSWKSLVAGVSLHLMLSIEKKKLYADLIRDRDYVKKAACLLLLSRFYGARGAEESSRLSSIYNTLAEAALAALFDADIWYDYNDNNALDGVSTINTVSEDSNEIKSELGTPAQYILVG